MILDIKKNRWLLLAIAALISACGSDSSSPVSSMPAAVWTGEVRILDATGGGVPGLLVQVDYSTQDLPKKRTDVVDVNSTQVSVYTDHDGIARPETADLGELWIHHFRVLADEEVLHEQMLTATDEQSLGELDAASYLFRFDLSVDYEISAGRDSIATASVIGSWRTAFVEDRINFGRTLTYDANGRFSGALTQDGDQFFIQGTWVVRNLILTTTFVFNGQSERHSTRFDVSGSTMTTRGIPAGTLRHWAKQ
jgi:hypothetical protein